MGQSSLWALVLAAVLGGAVGGGVVHYAGRKPPEKARKEAAAAPPAAADERLAALEARLTAVERQPGPGGGRGPRGRGAPRPDADDPAPAPPGASGVAPLVDDPVFGEAVRDVVERREEERRAARRERMQEHFDDRLADLKVDLGLSPDQATRVEKVLREAMDARMALWDGQGGEGERLSGRERRERARALRDDVDKKLGEILTPEQKQQYDEEASEWRGGRAGGERAGGERGGNRNRPE